MCVGWPDPNGSDQWQRQARITPAPHFAQHPEVRRSKAEALAARPLERGVAQRMVWDAVAQTSVRLDVASPTGAQADVFAAHGGQLDELAEAFPLRPGQAGAVLALGGTLCLDWISRSEAFERLWPKLRRGYLLDALERLDGVPTAKDGLASFLRRINGASWSRGPAAGLGADVRISGRARDRLRARAGRRAAPALRLHERRRRGTCVRQDRAAEPAALATLCRLI